MGAGASALSDAFAERPDLLDNYRYEYADLFSSEFQRLRENGMPEEELRAHFVKLLEAKEAELLSKAKNSEVNRDDQSNVGTEQSKDALLNDGEDDDMSDLTEEQMQAKHVQFVEACRDSAINIKGKTGLNFVCCVDGSEGSDFAFKTTMHLQRKEDTINIFHAYKQAKNLMEYPEMLQDNLRKKYMYLLFGLGSRPIDR